MLFADKTITILGKDITIKKEMMITCIIITFLLLGAVGYSISTQDNGIIIDISDDENSLVASGNNINNNRSSDDKNNKISINNSDKNTKTGTGSSLQGTIKEVSGMTAEDKSSAITQEEINEEMIKVYIVGCIKNPGIVSIKKGQMITDAIDAAGGLTEKADKININLVYRLDENVMLNIKAANGTTRIDASSNDENAGRGVLIIRGTGSAVEIASGSSDTGAGIVMPAKVNINTAGISGLDTLPGIGEVTAKDIISFREKNGKFKSIKDIMNVPGIKESRYDKIKELITID